MKFTDASIFNHKFNEDERLATKKDLAGLNKNFNILQFEPGIVLDIILDDSHPKFKQGKLGKINDVEQYPPNYLNENPSTEDLDYSNIGCALIRMCYSQQKIDKDELIWMYPLDYGNYTVPVVNEIVSTVKFLDKYYFTTKINTKGFSNTSADFRYEQTYGKKLGNFEFNSSKQSTPSFYKGPTSVLSLAKGNSFSGALGRYFKFNNKIRNLRKFEGDTVLESRFGQSIRFSSYDSNRNNDVGIDANYVGDGTLNKAFPEAKSGGGNPMILIRNRQKSLNVNNLKPNEKNVGGYIEEDVNEDGTSIHITSGLTTSKFKSVIKKHYFSVDNVEEQSGFNPNNSTSFKTPVLNGDQIVINSGRLIFQSRNNESIHFSKKRFLIATDSEFTVDAHDQIVFTTNKKTVINSPAIYLGEYDNTNEPVLLGQTTVDWLFELCNWILTHTHSDRQGGNVSPPNKDSVLETLKQKQGGNVSPPNEDHVLETLKQKLHLLMSRRVFVTGGGYAPGLNGGVIEGGTSPTSINISSGEGVPGTFKGKNSRK